MLLHAYRIPNPYGKNMHRNIERLTGGNTFTPRWQVKIYFSPSICISLKSTLSAVIGWITRLEACSSTITWSCIPTVLLKIMWLKNHVSTYPHLTHTHTHTPNPLKQTCDTLQVRYQFSPRAKGINFWVLGRKFVWDCIPAYSVLKDNMLLQNRNLVSVMTIFI